MNKNDLEKGCTFHISRTLGVFFSFLLLVIMSPSALAGSGEGSATIRAGTGANAGAASYSEPLATAGVTVGTKSYIRIDLTVGASNILANQNNVTVQIPTHLFPTNSWEVAEEAILADLDTVGEWIVLYTDTDSGTTDNSAIDLSASAAINTGLITIQANQQMDSTDIITIYAVVNDTNYERTNVSVPIQTDDAGADDLDDIVAGPSIRTDAATLTSTNVQPAELNQGVVSTVTVSFTTINSLANNGKVKITFPSGYDVSGATGGACSTMDGSFATAVSSQVVTLTRSGGTTETAGVQTCTIDGIRTPSSSGSTGTYQISTTDSSDNIIDKNLTVTADEISTGGGSGAPIITPYMACEDGIDNDGDGLTDLNDPGCDGFRDNDESDVEEEKEEVSTGGTKNTDKEVEEKKEEKKEEKAPEKTEEKSGGSAVSAEVKAGLKRLINYFDIRYRIKCKGSSANPISDMCRWAKIDIIYAQKMTGETKIADVELSDREIEITQKRLRWTKARYQKRCVEADTPHKSCKELKKAIDRAEYFVEKKSE